MTILVLHRDGWGASDSRTNQGNYILPDVCNKFQIGNGWLIGAAGDGVFNLLVKRILDSTPEQDILDAMSDKMQEKTIEAGAIMLNRYRELYTIDSVGHYTAIDDSHDYWVLGSSEYFVLGYLKRIECSEKRVVTPTDASEAIKLASRYDSAIDDRIKVTYLNG